MNSSINLLLFQLIRTSIDQSVHLKSIPSSKEWYLISEFAKQQAIIGICFNGLLVLQRDCPELTVNLPKELWMKWLGMAVFIQKRNELLNRKSAEVQELFSQSGFRSSILKGQGLASLYSSELRSLRQPGDIDVYVDASRESVISYAQKLGDEDPDWDYKHLHLKLYDDVEVEVHYVPEIFLNLRKNRKLQSWFAEHKESFFTSDAKYTELVTPSLEVNLFYVLLHIYRHFLYEGIGLRQLLDYYFVLKAYSEESNKSYSEIRTAIKSFGMERFAKGLMWVLQEVFCLEGEFLVCESDQSEGQYILNQIMQGGNFGHYDKRLNTKKKGKMGAVSKILKHNLHLLTRYPSDVVWAPVWVIYHFFWKRMAIKKMK